MKSLCLLILFATAHALLSCGDSYAAALALPLAFLALMVLALLWVLRPHAKKLADKVAAARPVGPRRGGCGWRRRGLGGSALRGRVRVARK